MALLPALEQLGCGQHLERVVTHFVVADEEGVIAGRRGVAAKVELKAKFESAFMMFQLYALKQGVVKPGSNWGQPTPPYHGGV